MSAAVLLDENLPRSLAALFTTAGYSVRDVRDIGLSGARDHTVFAAAQSHGAILVTRDRGFADSRRYEDVSHAGILVFRVPFSPGEQLLFREARVALERLHVSDLANAIAIVEPGRIRIRRSRG